MTDIWGRGLSTRLAECVVPRHAAVVHAERHKHEIVTHWRHREYLCELNAKCCQQPGKLLLEHNGWQQSQQSDQSHHHWDAHAL